VVVCSFVIGCGFALLMIWWETALAHNIPPHALSRVSAYDWMGSLALLLGILARPLFLWLKWTYNHIVHNWGTAIVLQTLIITIALLPLRITQMKSMLKMQRVQPQIKSIQEKYKKYSLRDPRKAAMNEEEAIRKSRVLVTGASGFLGVNLVWALREQGFAVRALVRRPPRGRRRAARRAQRRDGNQGTFSRLKVTGSASEDRAQRVVS